MSEEKHEEEQISEGEVLDIANELNSLSLEWSKRELTLTRFAQKLGDPQPVVICRGKYGNCGHPTPSEPHLTALLLAWCSRSRLKVQARCTRFEATKIQPMGPVYEIDDDYEGWFEIVSQEGKEMSYIQSVAELAECSNKTFVLMKNMHAHQCTLEGEWETCTLHIGYRITVMGEGILTDGLPACGCGELLRCESASALVWEPSETVYLPVEGSGRFALITGEDPLVGPKTVSCFRPWMLPVNVKLLEGSPPPIDPFTPYMRIISSAVEEVLTVLPMKKDAPLVHIPIRSRMELRVLDNLGAVQKLPRYLQILQRVRLTILPKHILRETYHNQHHQPSTPGLSSSSPNQNFKTSTKYFIGWFYLKNEETSEGRGYDHSFILSPKKSIVRSMETGSMQTCVEHTHTTGITAVSKEKTPPSNFENERTTDKSETQNLMVLQVKRVPNRHTYQLAPPPKGNVRSVETGSRQPCVEQPTTGRALVSKDKTPPLNIENEIITDESETRNLMDLQVKRGHNSHESDLAAHLKDDVPSGETRSVEPCVEQHTYGLAAVHKDKSLPSRIHNESSTDEVLETLNLDYPQVRRVPDRHIPDLASPLTESYSSMETGTMQPSVEQHTSRISAAHLEKNHPLKITYEKTKDVQHTPNLDDTQIKRRRSEPIKNVQQTSSLASVQPSKVRRSLRIETLQRKDDQQTSSLASVQPSKVRRSLRINTLQQKGDQQSSGIDTDLTH